MYLSEVEEIIAYIVCIAIVIGFAVSTYTEIKNTVAEEKEKQAEKEENEAKIKTLIHYLNTKKELIDSLAKTKKSIEEKQNKKYIETINIIGIKNKICLNSSYKFTLRKIRLKIIKIQEDNRDPKIIIFFLFENIFFSIIGKIRRPNNISTGNLKNSQIGI